MYSFHKLGILAVSLATLTGLAACGDNNHPSVSADQDHVEMPIGITTTVMVSHDGELGAFDPDLTWTVDDPAIASLVWNAGKLAISGRAIGTTSAHATYYGQDVQVAVVVDPAALVGVALNSAAITTPVGLDEQIFLFARLTDGTTQDVTSQSTWEIDDPTLIEISDGHVTGRHEGVTLVHASYGGQSATTQVTVTDAVLISIITDPTTSTIPAGLSVDYTAAGRYSDNTLIDLSSQARWSTENTAVATMMGSRATGVHAGTTHVFGQIGETTGTSDLTVSTVSVSGLVVTPDSATIPIDHTQQLRAVAQLSDGTTTDVSTQVAWTSAAPAIATVDADGTVHGAANGVTQVRADLGTTFHATAAITVSNATLLRLDVTPNPIQLAAGTHRQATATGVFSDGVARDLTGEATWSSDHPEIATVAAGDIVGTGAGAARITATASGVSSGTTVTVTAAQLVSITVTAPSLTLPVGTFMQLAATATYSDGSTQDVTSSALWLSDQPLRIGVSNLLSHGIATALSPGAANLSATIGQISGSIALTATSATLTRLELDPATLNLPIGSSRQVTATAVYSDGTTANVTAQAVWTSSAPAIASVSIAPQGGLVLGKAIGIATITARIGLTTATAAVLVTGAGLVSLQVSPDTLSLALGAQTQLTATATYSDGSHGDVTSQVLWTSSAPGVVAVSNALGSKGLATTQTTGGATISAAIGGVSGGAQVTVTAAQLTEIQLTPAALTLPAGSSANVVATGVYSDGSTLDLTAQVSWTSSAAATAGVTAGHVTAGTPGAATLTATLGATSATAAVTVTSAAVTGLAVNPPTSTLTLLQNGQLTATGTFSDGSSLDVTQQVTWSSSNPLVVLVSNAAGARGKVTGLLPGSATISATINGVTATATVTVSLAVLVSLQATPGVLVLPVGVSAPLTVIGTYNDGTTADLTSQVSFSTSAPAVVSVSANGTVSANAAGNANVIAMVGNASVQVNVTVTAAVLNALQVAPLIADLPLGVSRQFTATGVFSDGTHSDVTADVTWTSAFTAVATVSNVAGSAGQVSSHAIGVSTVTATLNGMSGTAVVTVTPALLTQLQLTPATLTLPAGLSANIVATGVYSDGSTHDLTALVGWSSGAPAIASVLLGHVSALATGTATITVTSGSTTATLPVTVSSAAIAGLAISPGTPTAVLGQSTQLTATATYSDGSTQDVTAQATWTSSNILIALVNNVLGTRGKVTGLLPGTATITAALGGQTASVPITVTAAVLTGLQISPITLSLAAGATAPLAVLGTYSDGTTIDVSSQAILSSSDPTIASVSANGVVSANAAGNATVTAAIGSTTAHVNVNVTAATLAQLQVSPLVVSLPLGITQRMTATGVYSDGSHRDVTSEVTWTSTITAVASVSNVGASAGLVTSQAIGVTTITAVLGASTAAAVVTVTPALLSQLQLTPATVTLPIGVSNNLVATGVYSDGSNHDVTALVSWSSNAPTIASVLLGHVTGLVPGTATITAGLGTLSAQATVTVTAAALSSLAINPQAPSLAVGQTTQLTATGTYSDSSSVNLTAQVTWTSSNPLVALISGLPGSQGRVQALLPGTTTITATLNGITTSVTLTVSAAVLASVQIAPGTLTLPAGLAAPLAIIGTYSDGTTVDLSSQAIWTSSAPATASVSANGLVSANAAGTTSISAAVGNLNAQVNINVTAANLLSIQVAPLVVNLPLGITTRMTATGVYSDGSHTDLTSSVTWTSSLPAFASVSNVGASAGEVTSHAVGATTITAAQSGVSSTAVVTVTPAQISQLQLTPASLTLPAGAAANIVATGVYSDGSTHDLTLLSAWASASPAVASVLVGHVTALTSGSATITATTGGLTATLTVTVSAAVLGELAVDPPHPTLSLAQTTQLTATGTYSDNSTVAVTAQALWTTSNPLIATVSNLVGTRGKVTGLVAGSATITATLDGASASVVVTVTPALLLGLQASPATVILPAGLSAPLAVTGVYSDGTSLDLTSQATFTSNTPSTASVSATGTVSANAAGNATVTAAVGGTTTNVNVTVTPALLSALQLSSNSLNLPLGIGTQLSATGVYSDGSHADASAAVTWTSSNPAVASVSNVLGSAGLVTTGGLGDATITASLGGVMATAPVHVGSATLSSIAVTGQTGLLPIGLSTQLSALGTYSDGSVVDLTSQATFASANPTVSVSNAVGSQGLALASSLGQSAVTASLGGVTGELTIGTTAAQLQSISVSSIPALPLGLASQLTATGHYSDGSTVDLTSQTSWASSNPAVATVANGLVTSIGLGSTQVSASLGGVTGNVTVGASSASLTSITLSPTALSLALGLSAPILATGHYTDGSTVDLTSQATWTSDNVLRATVTNVVTHGVVTGLLSGTAHITAQLGSISATATVTITSALLTSVTIAPTSATVALGQVKALAATAHYTDGSAIDVTTAATWSSSNAAIVAVSNLTGQQGAATGLGVGSATVTATLQLVSGTAALTVANGCHPLVNEVKTGTLLASRDEFVEIYNPCGFAIDLSHMRLAYRSALGLVDLALVDFTGTLAAGGYRVYGGPAYTGQSNGGLVTDLATIGGGIAIRDIPSGAVIDSMGYGTAINLFVEGLVALALPTGKSLSRIPNGVDTNSNAADFAVTSTPTPGAANQ